MKKLLFASFIACYSLSTFCQDSTATTLKPAKGSQTLELEASSPFAAAVPFSLNNSSLRYRYFLSEKFAFRVNVGFNVNNSKIDNGSSITEKEVNGINNTTESGKYTSSTEVFSFKILPGFEVHKNVAKRVSVYYGAFAYFELQFAKAKSEQTYGSYISNGQKYYNGFGSIVTESTGTASLSNSNSSSPSFLRYGASVMAGTDFYFTKALYLGVEVSLGFTNTVYSEGTIKVTDTSRGVYGSYIIDPDPTAKSVTTITLNKNSSAFKLAPLATGNLRFGFKF